jgi:hypothetical protein
MTSPVDRLAVMVIRRGIRRGARLIMRTYGTLPKHQTKHRRNGNDPNRLYFS